MKNTIKSLIIATSVAAIAGIGAVSFAAWSNTETTAVTPEGASGEVAARGISATHNLSTATNLLVPYNQTAAIKTGTAIKVWEITLTPTADTEANYTVKVTDNGSELTTANLKVFTGDTWVAPGAEGFDLTKFKTFGTDTAAIKPISNVVYIILDSGDTDKAADMGKAVKVKIELNANDIA